MLKPKVIIIGKLPPPYIGPAVATNIILQSALKERYELFHINTTVNKTVEEFGKGNWDKVGKNFKIYKTLFRLLRTEKPDLILIPISQTTLGFLKDAVFILLAALFPTKILLQLRGSNFKNWMTSAGSAIKSFVRFCLNKTDGIIVLGNNLRHLFEDYYTSDRIYVVPNGCDISIPPAHQKSDKFQLLYFANFLSSKGIKEVLEAICLLKQEGVENFELTAVGAWDNDAYKKECISLVNEYELPINFHSPRSGVEKWQTFANADIFLFTPNSPEGHPWVIVEALAAGLPVISTDQGAIVESVLNNQNGFIVKSNAPEQIAISLKKLILDQDLRKEFGLKSKQHYLKNFTEEKLVENLSSTFEKILD